MVKTYAIVVANLKAFADAHLEVKRFRASFLSNIEPFAVGDRTFPILYATPASIQNRRYTNSYAFTIRCLDKINDAKDNEIAILNSTEQIIRDLSVWLKESENGLELENEPFLQPLENYLYDGCVGWEATFEFSGPAFASECVIPFVSGFLEDYPDGQCDAVYHAKYLTCETLSACTVVQQIQSDLSKTITGVTQNNIAITVTDKKVALLDSYTTGLTFSNNILTLKQNNDKGDFNVNLTPFSAFTANSITAGSISATTISATTYLGLPLDIRVTGATYNSTTGIATFINNTGGTFTVSGYFKPSDDISITGGTVSRTGAQSSLIFTNNTGGTFTVSSLFDTITTGGTYSNGTVTFINNSGNTFTVTGFYTSANDIYTTGATKSGTIATFTNTTGGTFTLTGLTDTYITGGTISRIGNLSSINVTNNTGGTVTVSSIFDTFVTGATKNANIATFTNNSGNTFTLTGLTDTVVTGGTVTRTGNLSNLVFTNNTGGTFTVGSIFDTFVTGATKNGTIATFINNSGGTFTLTGLTDTYITGGTVTRSGNLSTISLLNNSGLTTTIGNIFDTFTTGATISGQTMIFTNNSGNTFTVTGFDAFTTGFTYDNANTLSLQRNQGQSPLTVTVNTMTGLTITSTTNNLNGITITKTVSGGTSTTDRGIRINNNWTALSNASSSSIIGLDIQNNNTVNYTDQSSNVVTNLHLNAGGTTTITSGASNNIYGIVRINPTFIDSNGGNNSRYNLFDLTPTITISGSASAIQAGGFNAMRVAPVFTAGGGAHYLFGAVGISSAFNISSAYDNISLVSFQSVPIIGSQNALQLTGYYHAPSLGSTGATITYHRAFWNVTGDNYFNSTGGNTGIGTVPTSTYKLDVAGSTRVSTNLLVATSSGALGVFGITNPTARVHIGGSTTAASTAQLKFNSGATMTTPETGAFEYDGVNLYVTPSNIRYRIIGNGLPTVSGGTGAGTAPTVSVSGNDGAMQVSVLTGAAPATGAIVATITFNKAFGSSPKVIFSPANAATALLSGASMVFMDTNGSTTTFTITAGSVALVTLTTYLWNISVCQ